MADISITAANVVKGSNAVVEPGTAGATITAGQVVYKDAADGKYKLADADSATAAAKAPRGIALNGASDGQPLSIIRSGDVTIGATVTAGTAYYLSPTPGGIAPVADVLSGDDVVLIGLAKSASVLAVDIQITGVTL
ncbi:MAG: hypothetical protein RLW68_01850 [Devosia marina]|uniref:hypothetical protein n=1 Tax=Devosia marina TaxID=2683198 RepID=UPI0032EE0E21